MSWLWFSCLALLFLLPPVSFAQSHLWQYRPFRANDTDHSGGDHICDLRRDSNADGKPERLGDYVTVFGSVIVEPSTFEAAGRLFWLRQDGCGILVCGEPEDLRLGDSVMVRGRLRLSRGEPLFQESGPINLGDIVLRKGGTAVPCGTGDGSSLAISPGEYADSPRDFGGNLLSFTEPVKVGRILRVGDDEFAWASHGGDSVVVYIDGDLPLPIMSGRCYMLTGVVIGIAATSCPAMFSSWCIAPRSRTDITEVGCSAARRALSWGHLKTEYRR
jgi:hypothetical protein